MSTNFLFQKFVDNAQQCYAFTPQTNFPAINLNFHWRWRWWDRMQATFFFYFTSPNLHVIFWKYVFKSKNNALRNYQNLKVHLFFQHSNEGLELERHLNEIGFLSEESFSIPLSGFFRFSYCPPSKWLVIPNMIDSNQVYAKTRARLWMNRL